MHNKNLPQMAYLCVIVIFFHIMKTRKGIKKGNRAAALWFYL